MSELFNNSPRIVGNSSPLGEEVRFELEATRPHVDGDPELFAGDETAGVNFLGSVVVGVNVEGLSSNTDTSSLVEELSISEAARIYHEEVAFRTGLDQVGHDVMGFYEDMPYQGWHVTDRP